MAQALYEDSNPKEQQAAAVLQSHFEELDRLVARIDEFQVVPGSLLEVDDRHTAYNPISHQVGFLLGASTDCLLTLQRTVQDHGMPMVAAYPLIRGAIESASQVLWLTTGGRRTKRVFRAVHRIWNMACVRHDALGHLVPEAASPMPRIRERLEELLAAAGASQRSLDTTYPSVTNMLIDAGRHVTTTGLRPVDVWRLCSSMAHANSSVALSVMESRESGPRDAFGSSFLLTTSFSTIAGFVDVYLTTLRAGLDARDRLNVVP